MNAPTSPAASETLQLKSVEVEISKLVEQGIPQNPPQIENDAERIRSSVARLTSTSIDGLQGLTGELQELQAFVKSEVERVQGEIDSALAGIKIIMDTIAPWKLNAVSQAPPSSAPPLRGGPAPHCFGVAPKPEDPPTDK
jgi:hypothetical protein